MKNEKITLTAKQFAKMETRFPANRIIVRIEKKDINTPSGIKLDFNDDVIYAEGTDSHAANVSTVMGTVAKVPDKLYFHPRDVNSMSWEVDGFDLQVGDVCFSHPLNVRNCDEIQVGDELFQVWPAEDCFCARRGGLDGEVICLNGNVILEPVSQAKVSELDIIPKGLDSTRAIVKYVGKPNKRYQAVQCADIQGLKVGDMVVIDKHTPIIWLERFNYNANFDHGKMYYVTQARHILTVL